mgnify:CR=1 FL=1
MNDGEDAYYISDLTFIDLIEELSGTSPPLLETTDRTITLTAEGREVLAGRRDRVAYGLDRWMVGVYLKTGETPIWRWDDIQRRVVSNPNDRPDP